MNAFQTDLGALLDQAGARPAGHGRFDCPECGGRRTVSVDESKNVFCCHHDGCAFHGGLETLRVRLGISKAWIPRDEYLYRREERKRADTAVRMLYERVQARRFELLEQLHRLNDLESTAHVLGADFEKTWDALETIDHDRPHIIAELTLLEESDARRIVEFLNGTKERQREIREEILQAGGLYTSDGKVFVEVTE